MSFWNAFPDGESTLLLILKLPLRLFISLIMACSGTAFYFATVILFFSLVVPFGIVETTTIYILWLGVHASPQELKAFEDFYIEKNTVFVRVQIEGLVLFLKSRSSEISLLVTSLIITYYTAPWIAFLISTVVGVFSLIMSLLDFKDPMTRIAFCLFLSKYKMNFIFGALNYFGFQVKGCHPFKETAFVTRKFLLSNDLSRESCIYASAEELDLSSIPDEDCFSLKVKTNSHFFDFIFRCETTVSAIYQAAYTCEDELVHGFNSRCYKTYLFMNRLHMFSRVVYEGRCIGGEEGVKRSMKVLRYMVMNDLVIYSSYNKGLYHCYNMEESIKCAISGQKFLVLETTGLVWFCGSQESINMDFYKDLQSKNGKSYVLMLHNYLFFGSFKIFDLLGAMSPRKKFDFIKGAKYKLYRTDVALISKHIGIRVNFVPYRGKESKCCLDLIQRMKCHPEGVKSELLSILRMNLDQNQRDTKGLFTSSLEKGLKIVKSPFIEDLDVNLFEGKDVRMVSATGDFDEIFDTLDKKVKTDLGEIKHEVSSLEIKEVKDVFNRVLVPAQYVFMSFLSNCFLNYPRKITEEIYGVENRERSDFFGDEMEIFEQNLIKDGKRRKAIINLMKEKSIVSRIKAFSDTKYEKYQEERRKTVKIVVNPKSLVEARDYVDKIIKVQLKSLWTRYHAKKYNNLLVSSSHDKSKLRINFDEDFLQKQIYLSKKLKSKRKKKNSNSLKYTRPQMLIISMRIIKDWYDDDSVEKPNWISKKSEIYCNRVESMGHTRSTLRKMSSGQSLNKDVLPELEDCEGRKKMLKKFLTDWGYDPYIREKVEAYHFYNKMMTSKRKKTKEGRGTTDMEEDLMF